ncbi:MAG: ComEC/Rec2 family competence protein [Patescibacteria group bacterium]
MRPKHLRLILIMILIIVASLRYLFWYPKITPDQLAYYNDQGSTTFIGLITSEPEKNLKNTKLVVSGQDLKGKVLITTYLWPEYHYGDQLEINCRLQAPQPIEDFAYDKYLAKSQIYSLCYQPQIKLLAQNQGNRFYSQILKVKNRLGQTIDQSLPSPQSALLKALLLGDRGDLPPELTAAFSRVSLTHIIAVSGSHLVIIIAVLMNLLLGLGLRRKVAFYFIVSILITYTLLVGAPASAVRATIMGIMTLLAQQIGRLNRSSWSLILTALVMLAINPLLLFYDVGFQLSFLSVWGLMSISPLLEKWLIKVSIPNWLGLKDSLIMTLAAQIATLPLIIYQFGQASLVAPLANLLILPAVELIMILGFAATFIGLINLTLGQILFYLEWPLLQYFIKTTAWLASWHYSALTGIKIGWWFLIASYRIILIIKHVTQHKT